MIKTAITFAIAFIIGAVISLATRTALHDPHTTTTTTSVNTTTTTSVNPVPPVNPVHHPTTTSVNPVNPVHHPTATTTPVNTVCPICGMDVDPSIAPREHNGVLVGLGCRACVPIFPRDPDRYTAAAVDNIVVGQ